MEIMFYTHLSDAAIQRSPGRCLPREFGWRRGASRPKTETLWE